MMGNGQKKRSKLLILSKATLNEEGEMLSREKLLEDIQMNNTTETNEKLVEMNELNKMLDVQLN